MIEVMKSFMMAVLMGSTLVACYPKGVPADACGSMIPDHSGFAAQQSNKSVPFSLIISAIDGNGTSSVPVTVTVRADKGKIFKGFMILAHAEGQDQDQDQDCNISYSQSIGHFQIPAQSHGKLVSCFNGTNNAVSHSDAEEKTEESFVWIMPVYFSGNVTFRATVLQSYSKFWTDIRSPTITISTL